jgi:hypothetical protein
MGRVVAVLCIAKAVEVDSFAGVIDPLDTDARKFDVDPICMADQDSPIGSSPYHHSGDALKLSHDAADTALDAEVDRLGVSVLDDARQAVSIILPHRLLQVHRDRSPAKVVTGR